MRHTFIPPTCLHDVSKDNFHFTQNTETMPPNRWCLSARLYNITSHHIKYIFALVFEVVSISDYIAPNVRNCEFLITYKEEVLADSSLLWQHWNYWRNPSKISVRRIRSLSRFKPDTSRIQDSNLCLNQLPDQRIYLNAATITCLLSYCSEIPSRTAWPLKMGPTGCPEKSVATTLRCVTSQKAKFSFGGYLTTSTKSHSWTLRSGNYSPITPLE
jgi:hypothetical protein